MRVGAAPFPLLERRPAQILVAVASTPSGEERPNITAPLCAVEDWSGAGFHTNSR